MSQNAPKITSLLYKAQKLLPNGPWPLWRGATVVTLCCFVSPQLLVDKDTLVSALNTAHDTHLLTVDNKEDDISRRSGDDLAKILEDIQSEELTRNRKKVSEINKYIEIQRGHLRVPTSAVSSDSNSPYLS